MKEGDSSIEDSKGIQVLRIQMEYLKHGLYIPMIRREDEKGLFDTESGR